MNACEWKARSNREFSSSMHAVALERCRILGCAAKKRKQKKATLAVAMSMMFAVVLLAVFSFSSPALSASAKPAVAPPVNAEAQKPAGLNEHADLLFILAVPLGFAALFSQCVTLKQISDRIRK